MKKINDTIARFCEYCIDEGNCRNCKVKKLADYIRTEKKMKLVINGNIVASFKVIDTDTGRGKVAGYLSKNYPELIPKGSVILWADLAQETCAELFTPRMRKIGDIEQA